MVDEADAAAKKKKEEIDREIEVIKQEYEEKLKKKKQDKELKKKKEKADKDKKGKEDGDEKSKDVDDKNIEEEKNAKVNTINAAIEQQQLIIVEDKNCHRWKSNTIRGRRSTNLRTSEVRYSHTERNPILGSW